MPAWKKAENLVLEQSDEFRIHVFVYVRNLEAHDALVCQVLAKSGSELAAVALLHHEDDVSPLDQLWRQRVAGVVVRTGGRTLDTRMAGEDLLGRRATKEILAADKQYVLHRRQLHLVRAEPRSARHLSQRAGKGCAIA